MNRLAVILPLHIFCCLLFPAKGQQAKYRQIDSLLKRATMVDAISARRQLETRFSADTLIADYWKRHSQVNQALYKYELALTSINKAIRIDSADAELFYEKGRIYNDLNQPELARDAFSESIRLKPVGRYYYWRGIMHQQLKLSETALEDYKRAISGAFELPELYCNYAILLCEQANYAEALAQVNKALVMNPGHGPAYSIRSKIHVHNLALDSSCADANRALNAGYRKSFTVPAQICNGPEALKYHFLAEVLAGEKDYEQAIKAYTRLIGMGEDSTSYYLGRGYCYYGLKDYEKAEQDYLKALALPRPARDILYDNLSLLYFEQKKYLEAINYSTKRIELNPENHVPYIDRGLCYRKLKKYKEAEKDFNKSLAIKPDFFRAFGYRAFLSLELGNYEQARADAQRSVNLYPKYAYGYLVLGQAKMQLGIPDFCMDLYSARNYGDPDAEEAIRQFCK